MADREEAPRLNNYNALERLTGGNAPVERKGLFRQMANPETPDRRALMADWAAYCRGRKGGVETIKP